MKKLFLKLKKKIARTWEKTKYTFARSLITQIMMLAISIGQWFCSMIIIAVLVDTLKYDGASAVIGAIIFGAGAFCCSMLMVLLKGLGKTEYDLPDCYYINWEKVSDEHLAIAVSHMAKRYSYAVHNVNPKIDRVGCIREINKISWELDDNLRDEMLELFRPYRIYVHKSRDNFWKNSLLCFACSPISFGCQIVSLCVLCTSQWASRNVVSTLSGVPFSMSQLPKKQKVMRFLFNAVDISEFEPRAWLGKFDVRK